MKNRFLLPIVFLAAQAAGLAQSTVASPAGDQPTAPAGGWARLEVVDGDSVYVMSLYPVRIVDRRNYKDREEQLQYYRYRNAARRVYGYAMQALDLYDQVGKETEDMSRRQRRRYLRHEGNEFKEDFADRLKNLTKTEGKVLLKMVEKETGKPMYTIIKETRGGLTAAYWHNLGKIWGYDLKEGYKPGDDPLLDDVFLDYDFGHPEVWYQ